MAELHVEQVANISWHHGSIYSLVRTPDQDCFLSAGSEGIVVKCNLKEPDKAVAIAKVDGHIFSMLLLTPQNHLIIGTMSGSVHIVDLNEGREIHTINHHKQSIFDIKIHQQKIYIASKDGNLSIWSAENYSIQSTVSVSEAGLRMIDFHPGKAEAAIACSDHKCYILDPGTLNVSNVLIGPQNSVFSVCYSPHGEKLLIGSRDARLYVYDTDSATIQGEIAAHLYTVNHIIYISDKLFCTASRDKTIRIWDYESFELLKSIDRTKDNGHRNSVNRLLWMPEEEALVSAGDDRTILLWKISM
jgi:WD40 repeat protein